MDTGCRTKMNVFDYRANTIINIFDYRAQD